MVYLTLLAYGCYKNRLKEKTASGKNSETASKSNRWDEKPDQKSASGVENNLGSSFKPVVVYSDSEDDGDINTTTNKGKKRHLEDKSYPQAKQKSTRFKIIQNFIPTPVLRTIPLVETLPESLKLDNQPALSQNEDEMKVDQTKKGAGTDISTSTVQPTEIKTNFGGMKINLPVAKIDSKSKQPPDPNTTNIFGLPVIKNVGINPNTSDDKEVGTKKINSDLDAIPIPRSEKLPIEPSQSQTKSAESFLEQIELPSNLPSNTTIKEELTKNTQPANTNSSQISYDMSSQPILFDPSKASIDSESPVETKLTNEVKILEIQEKIHETHQEKILETNEKEPSLEETPQIISEKQNLNSAAKRQEEPNNTFNLPTYQLSYKSNPYSLYKPILVPSTKKMSSHPSNMSSSDHEKQTTSKEQDKVKSSPDNDIAKASGNQPDQSNFNQLLNNTISLKDSIENENSSKINQETTEINEQATPKHILGDVDITDNDHQQSAAQIQTLPQKPNPIKINLLGGVGKSSGGVLFGKALPLSSSNAGHKDYPEMDQIENFVTLENQATAEESNEELCDDKDEVVEHEVKKSEQQESKGDTQIIEFLEGDRLSQVNSDVDQNKELLPGNNLTPYTSYNQNHTFQPRQQSYGLFRGTEIVGAFPPHRGVGARPQRGPGGHHRRGGRGMRPQRVRGRGRGWGY